MNEEVCHLSTLLPSTYANAINQKISVDSHWFYISCNRMHYCVVIIEWAIVNITKQQQHGRCNCNN